MSTTATTSTNTASASASLVTVSVAPSKNGRTAGKAHKSSKEAVRRSYISESVKTPFEKRMEAQKKIDGLKAAEKEMKDEIKEEKERKVNIIKERRARQEEKKRMEEMRARMSAKKLQRMKKRQGRTKKING